MALTAGARAALNELRRVPSPLPLRVEDATDTAVMPLPLRSPNLSTCSSDSLQWMQPPRLPDGEAIIVRVRVAVKSISRVSTVDGTA